MSICPSEQYGVDMFMVENLIMVEISKMCNNM